MEEIELQLAWSMLKALRNHKKANAWLDDDGEIELTCVWEDPATGLLCKCRIDKVSHGYELLPDIKTTRDISQCRKSIFEYGYHISAAFYQWGYSMATLEPDSKQYKSYTPALIFIDKFTTEVIAAPVGEESLLAGAFVYRNILSQIAECEKTGNWPGIPDPEVLDVPDHRLPQKGLTQGGEPLL